MKIKDISKPAERVEPEKVAKALGAERISDIEKILREKIKMAVELTSPTEERFYLIRWIMVSSKMQGLIINWNYKMSRDEFVLDIQVCFTPWPRLLISVPLREE